MDLLDQQAMTQIKICGITTEPALRAAEKAGATFVGFVFFAKSPRNITPPDAANLMRQTALTTVGLFVNPDDDALDRVLNIAPLSMIQLHGDETPARVAHIRARTGLPVIKAIPVADKTDLAQTGLYAETADWLLFDAKLPNAPLPGGTGRNFDWSILDGFKSPKPWMLAGGLNADNVADALARLRPDAVDVSSGAESAPGIKDAGKIVTFIDRVRAC